MSNQIVHPKLIQCCMYVVIGKQLIFLKQTTSSKIKIGKVTVNLLTYLCIEIIEMRAYILSWKLPFFKNCHQALYCVIFSFNGFVNYFCREYQRTDLYLSKFNFTNLPHDAIIIVMNFGFWGKNVAYLSIFSANKTEGIVQSQKLYLL